MVDKACSLAAMLKLIPIGAVVLLAHGCASSSMVKGHPAAVAGHNIPRHYVCCRSTDPVVIDGRISEPVWDRALWTDLFVDIEGEAKPRPRLATRAKMLWDDAYFYIAAKLEEPHVWGTLREHDQIVFHDNDFEVFIDPDGDTREYYEIEINALGTIFDLFLERTYLDGGPAHHDWDLNGLKAAVHVDGTLNDPADVDRGWSLELALPWRWLAEYAHRPAPPRDGDVWRGNFSRVAWQHRTIDGRYEKVPDTREDNWVWSPQGQINMHVPEHWGYVRFSNGAD